MAPVRPAAAESKYEKISELVLIPKVILKSVLILNCRYKIAYLPDVVALKIADVVIMPVEDFVDLLQRLRQPQLRQLQPDSGRPAEKKGKVISIFITQVFKNLHRFLRYLP